MSDFNQFIAGIPKITRLFTVSTLTAAFLNVLNILPSYHLIYLWKPALKGYQVWRFFTGFIVTNPQPMQGLMDIYMLYSYSRGIEENKFYGDIADYAFYLSIIMPLITLSSVFTNAVFLLQPLLGALTYTWSRANRNQTVSIYFLPIKATHLPIVFLGFRLLLEGPRSFFSVLSGVATAYIYACIESRSLGPLYSYICDTIGINVIRHKNQNKVGTIHTINEVVDGYLVAPNWFRNIIGFFFGGYGTQNNLGSSGQRLGGGVKSSNVKTLSDQSGDSTTARSSGFSFVGSGSTFKGKGQRLGGS
ncbi:hypothetical protein WICMUC_003882 [Wickerhamomyces mucosus]|uniref:Derlin n=1 Tax=Wickerhamomyces mucosus TaxID=1378264 RepID=A0A9P8TBK9_9ASCO|nr:hypothetical protein WICMUC_003882 [Wickerhamomyces mucosus]